MSFIKKSIKKSWKITKKVVKSKVFKYIVIAAAIFFTAGVASGGFAAFAAASAASGGMTAGSFFVAVGQTMATGAAAMAGGVGLQGASASLAAHGGAAATAAGLAGAPGIAGAVTTGLGAAATSTTASLAEGAVASGATSSSVIGGASAVGVQASPAIGTITAQGLGNAALTGISTAGTAIAPTTAAAGAGWSSVLKDLLGKEILGDVTTGQLLTSAALSGVKSVLAGKDKQKFPNSYVAGGLARGGGTESPGAFNFGDSTGQPAQISTPQAEAEQNTDSIASQYSQGLVQNKPEVAPDPFAAARSRVDAIRTRLDERDAVAQQDTPAAEAEPQVQNPQQGLLPQQQTNQGQNAYGPFYDQATQIGGLA